jgi:6-phosphofructokinase 1
MARNRLAVLTSGGDAPGMNAAVRAVVKGARDRGCDIVGIWHGGLGLVRDAEGDYGPLHPADVSGILDRSGTILKTARNDQIAAFLRGFDELSGLAVDDDALIFAGRWILANCAQRALVRHGVEGLILVGGDQTARAALLLASSMSQAIPMVVIPASIDNDVDLANETVGFDSAVAFAVSMVDAIRATATSHDRVFIVEVMGRTKGQLAREVALATGADELLIPEESYAPSDIDALASRIRTARSAGHASAIVVVAEGVDASGWGVTYDAGFPHPALALDAALRSRVRDAEIRTAILGHTQRGAPPTARSRKLATQYGLVALDDVLAQIRRNRIAPPRVVGLRGSEGIRVSQLRGEMVRPETRADHAAVGSVRRLGY